MHTALATISEDGLTIIEGPPDTPLIEKVNEISAVIEACFGAGTQLALLYAENLPPAFFDLSSQQAGEILQKLRNYGIRFALVISPTTSTSHRFGEMVAEERAGRAFGVFGSREDALTWLREN